MNTSLDKIHEVISKSDHVVVLSGLDIVLEAGLNGVRGEHIAYDIEQKYGYANDEIITSMFYSRRVDLFYKYYKEVILNKELKPTPVHEGIVKIQDANRLDAVITRTTYSLHKKVGCKNVIELHGSVEENSCPNCGKIFGSEHIRNAASVPVCDDCGIPLRPGFALLGETVDNGKMTKASNAVEDADVLLVIGAGLNSALCRHLVKYYKGNKMIVLGHEEAMGDERANYQAYGNLGEMLTEITKDLTVSKVKRTSESVKADVSATADAEAEKKDNTKTAAEKK